MNFLQIAQEIMDAQDGDRPTTIYASNLSTLSQEVRRLRNHINKALNVVKLALGIQNESAETTGTITTVAGQESYAFPTGILTIQQIRFANDLPLQIVQWDEFERYKSECLIDYTPINSNPYTCAIYQRKVWFFPIPDQVYTVSVRGLETLVELNHDEDIPDLPDEFHRVIREFALYFEMKYENNPQAGVLVVSPGGRMSAQGGQAADAVLMFELVKKTFKQSYTQAPRMKSIHELQTQDYWRRNIRLC